MIWTMCRTDAESILMLVLVLTVVRSLVSHSLRFGKSSVNVSQQQICSRKTLAIERLMLAGRAVLAKIAQTRSRDYRQS